MLVIRDEQMAALSQAMVEGFRRRMAAHLRAVCSEQTAELSDEALRDLVRSGMAEAEAYDIVYEDEIERFLEKRVRHAPDFAPEGGSALVRQILLDPTLDGEAKMAELDLHYGEGGS
jgi:hypothetical protein